MQQKSPWLILALGTLGLVVGYSAVVVKGGTAFANVQSCPLKAQGTCEHCNAAACEKGECGKDCPGCAYANK